MRDSIYKMITDTVEHAVEMCFSDDVDTEEWDLEEFNSVSLSKKNGLIQYHT